MINRCLGEMDSLEYVIITHTDIDGVGAAALYTYLQGAKPVKTYFTEPYLIQRLIPRIKRLSGIGKVVFMDLGLNSSVYPLVKDMVETLTGKKVMVEWYDHHIWDKQWLAELSSIGARIHIDKSTCATGVVAKYAPRNREDVDEEFVDELVKGVCAGDLFRFDHWRGPWFLRLVRRHDDPKWRLRVLEVLSSGTLWIDEFTDKIIERLESELRGYSRVKDYIYLVKHNGVKIAVTLSIEGIENSFLAAHVMGRYSADVVALTSPDGKVSLRSKRHDVRELAYILGGGGHAKASGCKLKIPWKIRLKSLIDKKAVINYVLQTLIDAINDIGGLKEIRE